MDIFTDEWDQSRVGWTSIETMRRIATDIMQLDQEDDDALYAYVAEHDLTVNEAVYYLNAYQFGGDSGLRAIRNPEIIPPETARRATKTVARMLDDHFQGRMSFRITDEGTAIGVYEIKEYEGEERYLFAICQVRLTLDRHRWHLYWKRKFNAWWPYSLPETGRKSTLGARMRQVLEDQYGCFWG